MTYYEINSVLSAHPENQLPYSSFDEEGNRIVINDGYRDIYEDGKLIPNMHFYRVFTYKGASVETMLYFANGCVIKDTSM